MSIRTVITRGFGNVTFNGSIALAALRGYLAGPPIARGDPAEAIMSNMLVGVATLTDIGVTEAALVNARVTIGVLSNRIVTVE